MNPRVVAAAAFLSLAVLFTAYTLASHAAVHAKAPDIRWPQSACNLANRMNIAVIDGLLFECVCSRLQVNYECSWWIVAGVNTAQSKRVKRHHVTRIYVLPAVTA